LLVLLLELRAELGIVLSIAHVNHKLRGHESDADEQFVAKLARKHELELHGCDAPVDGRAGLGIEAAARELRYDFFAGWREKGTSRRLRQRILSTIRRRRFCCAFFVARAFGDSRAFIRGSSSNNREARWARLCAPCWVFDAPHCRSFFANAGRSGGKIRRIWTLFSSQSRAAPAVAHHRGRIWRSRHRAHGELAEIARAEEECWEPSTQYQYPVPSTRHFLRLGRSLMWDGC